MQKQHNCSKYVWQKINTFLNNKFKDSFILKVSVDANFKFNENNKKFSKWVENNAHYKQFLLFPQCFQKTYTIDM